MWINIHMYFLNLYRGNVQKFSNPAFINSEALVNDDKLALNANDNNNNNNGNLDSDEAEKERLEEHFGVDL